MKSISVFLHIRFVTLLMAVISCVGIASAATVNWLPTSGTNDYNTGANWSTSSIPTGSDVAAFPAAASGNQTIAISASPATQPSAIEIGTTSGTLTFEGTGAGLALLQAGATLTVGTGAGGADVLVQRSGAGNLVFRSAGAFIVGGMGASNNSMTFTGSGVSTGSTGSIVILGFDGASGNNLNILSGAALSSTGGTIGRINSDNNTLTVSGTGSAWTVSNNPASGNISLGQLAGNNNNNLVINNGGLVQSSVELRAYRGALQLDGGTLDLTYDFSSFTADQDVLLQAAGRIEGQGTIMANALSSSQAGATVEVGTGGFGWYSSYFPEKTRLWSPNG